MGGSSGGYFGGNLDNAKRDFEHSQTETDRAAYDAETNGFLQSLLTNFNGRDQAAIKRRLQQVEEAIGKNLKGTIELMFGGSVAKHTHVDGLSDIDSLVLLDSCELADRAPSEAREYLGRALKDRFPDRVSVGRLAVTVRFDDAEIQVLPAISCKNHVKISDASVDEWSAIRPQEFATVLSKINAECAGKVVPTVKLAKAIVAELPEPQQISGYHAESLAVEIFRRYDGSKKHSDMLQHYFEGAADRVLRPIVDKTGQSVHVDDSLGGANSVNRKIVSDAFSRVARRMKNAERAGRPDDWKPFFGEK